ncbi:hypothetical protein [Saccharomonospora cyanea]|uniref:Uncharacterized protein n=1 Tax=Saccharomonospora cyanea NA-134 TaxID=882082 RepID=H5XHC1_9PSEU|nr:hypothetical protein [Saccharomonospora cyanea]EHR60606.1 hypothetical protein SaccyDRAFT_1708 [Saccharomonospora cyanea NA-134]
MARTKPGIKSVKIENLNIWADGDGMIHLTTDDPDVRDDFKNTYVSNNPDHLRYHPALYARLARILRRFDKEVPGWEDEPAAN